MIELNKVIIIGAGPAGIAAALQLKQHNNVRPVIYEIRAGPSHLGGAIGIPSNGLRLLSRLGLYEAIAARGAAVPTLSVHAASGQVLGQMDTSSWSQAETGFGNVRIRRADLMAVLLAAADHAGIPIHYSKRLTAIEDRGSEVAVHFEDGEGDAADFLLGCDGIHSAVRALHVDPDTEPEYSGIANVYGLLDTARLPSAASGLEGMHATLTVDGTFVVVPCRADRSQVYWFCSREVQLPAAADARDGWEQHQQAEVERLKDTMLGILGDASGGWVEVLREAVRKSETLKYYPIFRMPLGRRWSRSRCLLLGDAAHAMPPHASQGVSMAMEDVFMLSQLLRKDLGSVDELTSAFEEKRQPRIALMFKTAARNAEVRRKEGPWQHWLKEHSIHAALWIYWALDLDRFGLGQGPLAYDVEKDV